MNKTLGMRVGLLVLGVLIAAAGVAAVFQGAETYAGIGLGIGSGLIGANTSLLLTWRYYRKHPEAGRQKQIELSDERNTLIRYRAKAKAFDRMLLVMTVIPFLLIAAEAPLWQVIAVVAVYLLGYLLQTVYMVKLSKEM